MSDMKFEKNVYLGKMFHKGGIDKKKVEWKLYKTQWGDPERPLKRNKFEKEGNKGLSLTQLEEGTEYEYGYTEYNGTTSTGEDYISKTITFIKESKEVDTNKIPEEIKEFNFNTSKEGQTIDDDAKKFFDIAISKGIKNSITDYPTFRSWCHDKNFSDACNDEGCGSIVTNMQGMEASERELVLKAYWAYLESK